MPNKTLAIKKNGNSVIAGQKLTENEQKAYDLRGAGASYREIAEALGFKSPASALDAVKRAVAKTQFESATEALLMDLAQLDDWFKRLTHRIRTTGDLSQIPRAMAVMEKKHQLLGVDSTTLAEKMGKKTTAGGATIVIAPSENAFIEGMMRAVGVDPSSPEAQAYFKKKGPDKGVSIGELEAGSPSIEEMSAPVARKATGKKKKLKLKRPTTAPRTEPVEAREEALSLVDSEVLEPTLMDIYPSSSAPSLRESAI